MQVGMESSMQQIKGRVLPGPWLNYKIGQAGQEETKAFKTGTSGVWNMNNFKFSGKIEVCSVNLDARLAAAAGVYLQQQLPALRKGLSGLRRF
jgi:hypothetical protein